MGHVSDAQHSQRMEKAEAEGLWGVWYRQADIHGDWCKYCHGLAGSIPDGGYYYDEGGAEVKCQSCGRTANVRVSA